MTTRRFGSPPEVHRRGRIQATEAMKFWLREARRSAKEGKCSGAFESLVAAERMAAVAATEGKGTGKRYSFQIDTLRRAEVRFSRACLKR